MNSNVLLKCGLKSKEVQVETQKEKANMPKPNIRKKALILMCLSILIVTGCSTNSNNTEQPETSNTQTSETNTSELSGSDENRDETTGAYPPSVMVDGIVYQDTGYVDSMVTCGTMDGEITSSVDDTKLPTENNQSNFGSGYGYQLSEKDQIVVEIDGEYFIFRNIDSKDDFIPDQVFNFKAKVKEIRNGSLLVTYIDTADGFQEMMSGDYIVSAEKLTDEVEVGDIVQIWFDGSVEESAPYQLDEVYRIEKE